MARGRSKNLALRIPVVRMEMGTNHLVQEQLADLLKRVGCYFGADPDDVKVAGAAFVILRVHLDYLI